MTFITHRTITKSKSFIAVVLLGAVSIFGLMGCGSDSGNTSPQYDLTINSPSINESQVSGTGELVFTLTLSAVANSNLTVDYATTDGSATEADGDYTVANGSVTILAGTTSVDISVYATGDNDFETDETINLVVNNPQGIVLTNNEITAIGTITNDDNAEPKGYFTGTATLDGVAYDDLTGLMLNNRLMLFSPTANMLYDISANIALADISGAVKVYENGELVQASAVTVSGSSNNTQITGSFVGGSGLAAGSFDISFDAANNQVATIARIDASASTSGKWIGNVHGIDVDTGSLTTDSLGGYSGLDDNGQNCDYSGSFAPDSANNIYGMAHDIGGFRTTPLGCQVLYESAGHTGYASVINGTGTDNKLIYAFANGEFALFAVMTK